MKITLEICVEDASGLDKALAAGADRIELCSSLDVGGLTPSCGLMAYAATLSVPVYALIRPRAGNFHFSRAEEQIMCRDIEAARQAGLSGVVIGASHADNSLNVELLARLIAHAKPLKTTLHRVFDLVPDPFHALEQAIELGFDHILTSGGKPHAIEALSLLARLQAQATGRIAIMPGGGIDETNAAQIVAATGVHHIHASCRDAAPLSTDAKAVQLGFQSLQQKHISAAKIRALRTALLSMRPDSCYHDTDRTRK